jgi:hypothetical protein
LEAGETLDVFLRDFPNVTRDLALSCLRGSGERLIRSELGAAVG